MADAEEHSEDLPEAIGEHRVAGPRRRDGVGLLCEAEGDDPERPLLLRTLGPRWRLSTAAQQRFRELASATRRAAHGGIARIAASGEHEGLPYVVLDAGPSRCLDELLTELVDTTGARRPKEARRLGELLAGRRIDAAFDELWGGTWTDMSADLALQAARALERAHGTGLVHGDLGPHGVLVDDKARLRLFDFGLGHLGSTSAEGEAGARLASPHFLAPELWDGAAPTPASDLWSLGVLLYRLLCGRLPFPANDPERLGQAVRGEEPPLPWKLDRDVPRPLGAIVWKCLRKEPARRYASAGELAEDLERYFAGQPVRARVPGPLARGLAYARKHPLRVLPVPAAVALLVVLVALPGSGDAGEHGSREAGGGSGGKAGSGSAAGAPGGGARPGAPAGGERADSLAEAITRLIEKARGRRQARMRILFVGVEDRGGFGAEVLGGVVEGLRFPDWVEAHGAREAERLLAVTGWQAADLWSPAALGELAHRHRLDFDGVLCGTLTRDADGRALLSLQLYDRGNDRIDREGLHVDGEPAAREGFDRDVVSAVEALARRCPGLAGRGTILVLALDGGDARQRAHAQAVLETALLDLRPTRLVPSDRTARIAARRGLDAAELPTREGALELGTGLGARVDWLVGGTLAGAGVALWAVDGRTGERH